MKRVLKRWRNLDLFKQRIIKGLIYLLTTVWLGSAIMPIVPGAFWLATLITLIIPFSYGTYILMETSMDVEKFKDVYKKDNE